MKKSNKRVSAFYALVAILCFITAMTRKNDVFMLLGCFFAIMVAKEGKSKSAKTKKTK